MARFEFGAGGAETFVGEETSTGYLKLSPGASVTVWDAETGGLQITDLTDVAGTPIGATLVTDSVGKLPRFKGPDGVSQMWVDSGTGSPRTRIVTADAATGAAPASDTVAGLIEIATQSEVDAEASTTHAVVPARLAAWYSSKVGASSSVPRSTTISAAQSAVGWLLKLVIDYDALSTDAESVYVEALKSGTLYRTFWLNESGSPRAASLENEPALKLFGPSANPAYTGAVLQVADKWSGTRTNYYGIDARGRPRLGPDELIGANCLVLAAGAPVPANTPAGTVIVRTA